MFQQHSQFYKSQATEQKPNEVVDVTQWERETDAPYPVGARKKYFIYSPKEPAYKFLLPKHPYLFKVPGAKPGRPVLYWQFWHEIIAYKLGRILDIPVPPAFVGCEERNSQLYYGAIIEWFYRYSGAEDVSNSGGALMVKYNVPGYDPAIGNRPGKNNKHDWQTVMRICKEEMVVDWLKKWSEILLFDALIANTDRHQDNWEIIVEVSDLKPLYQYTSKLGILSPAFDNGTSMGYNIRQTEIANFDIEKYNCGGYHHMNTMHMKSNLDTLSF